MLRSALMSLPSVKISQEKKRILIQTLEALYPQPQSELQFSNEYELLISVVLSAQCTDKKVNEVTKTLFKKFPNFHSLSKAKVTDIENIIRQVNYFKTKSKHLKLLAEKMVSDFNSIVPHNFALIRTLPGVGQKTANVVLGELGVDFTFPVDTHVFRVSKRLGLATHHQREQVEEQLKKLFPKELWRNFHHWLILHGRRVCKAQNPHCSECALRKVCTYSPK